MNAINETLSLLCHVCLEDLLISSNNDSRKGLLTIAMTCRKNARNSDSDCYCIGLLLYISRLARWGKAYQHLHPSLLPEEWIGTAEQHTHPKIALSCRAMLVAL